MSAPSSPPNSTPSRQVYLPVDHPGFRYVESRNPYWKKIKDLQSLSDGKEAGAYLDHDAEAIRGQWKARLAPSPSSALHVEIGCNGGHVLIPWAERNPVDLFVGVDWKYKQIYLAREKARTKRDIPNAVFVRNHAERMEYLFGEGEIDRLYVFCPDPWPRKSQWKNRTVRAEWLKRISKLMAPDGVLWIKTDHDGYFDWMLEAIQECQLEWETLEMTRDLHAGHPAPETLEVPDVTLFERIFIRDGITINSVKLRKRG